MVTSTPGSGLDMRRQNYARLVATTARVPQELRQTLRDCGTVCGIGDVQYGHVDGLANEVALVWIDGFNGPEGTVVFVDAGTGSPRMAFAHYGPDAMLRLTDGSLQLTRSMYGQNDPESSPSGRPEVSTYRWTGSRFVLQERTGGGANVTAYLPNDRVVT